jgi:hypothetical protein
VQIAVGLPLKPVATGFRASFTVRNNLLQETGTNERRSTFNGA